MKFAITDLPEDIKNSMQTKNIWLPSCPVDLSRLKLLELSYYNFDSQLCSGYMVVLDKVANAAISIFRELLKIKFPIHTIKLIDEFQGNDKLSMQANNSSCFNFRKIEGSDMLSLHSYGVAIDINPLQNPMIQNGVIQPNDGDFYLDRNNLRPGMVEPIINIFNKYGFTVWGGNWKTPVDYHHFQIPRNEINELIND